MAAPKTVELQVCSEPHNGKREHRRVDPVDGLRVGGQYLYIRSAIRYRRFVGPLGRRWGKTTLRPFLWATEMLFTKGQYVAAFITSVHQKAWEAFSFSRDQLGGLVKDSKGEPESQNRYIDLRQLESKEDPAVAYAWAWNDPVIGPRVRANWGKNTGGRVYFLSGQYPMVQAIQGFPFPFDRISIDEAQQQHPMVTRIVTPMLLDSGGGLDVSGIPDIDSIGNTWFSEYWDRTKDPKRAHRWAGINFPTYDNPHLNKEALAEVEEDLITQDDVDQYVWARFLSGSGAVFGNLDKVFVLPTVWHREHPSQADGPAWWKSLFLREPSDVMKTWIHEADPTPGHNYAMTVDFAGRTRTRDATALHVYDMTENKMACAISIRGMTSPGQLAWIEGVKDHYGANEIYGDETPEGAALMGYLRERYRTGVNGIRFSSSNKAEFVKRGVFLFEMEEVRMIDCAEIKNEFQKYKRIATESLTGKDGPVSYSHPPGKHDDHVSAFLQIAPSMAYGRRSLEHREPPKPDLIDKDGLLDLSALNSDLDDDLAEGEDAVRVRVPRR